MTLVILTRWRSPGVRLRRCVLPVPIARRCLPFCPVLAGNRDACGWWPGTVMPAARRGYGYGSGSAVVDGMSVVPVQVCRFLRAGAPRRTGTTGRVTVRPCPVPPARRGYRCVAGAPVVRGTALVPVQVCRFLRAGAPRRTGTTGRVTVRANECSALRAHCLSENRSRRLSARRSAVKTAERSEALAKVLTARQRRALQSRAVFRRNAPDKT